MLTSPFAHIIAEFLLDGKKYEVEKFKMKFTQPTDFKGCPQHETQGGKLTVTLSHAADDNLYLWAKQSTLLKNGSIIFQTDLGISILRVEFEKGYCINLTREINAHTGTNTTLIISSEIIKVNDVEHDNFWP